MTEAEIYRELTEIFHDIFDDDTLLLKPDMTAAAVPEWDSHNHISIIVAAERRFGINFQTAEIETLRNVGEMVQTIHRKVGGKQG
jgi:acyl carrier protein